MGRSQPTMSLAPAGFRKDGRAKHARATVNKTIPDILKANSRARRGVDAAELIVEPPRAKQTDEVQPGALTIRLHVTDTITAASRLGEGARGDNGRTAILNMASPLRPGGGVLNGATSQEEFLCVRTTLLPSLRDEFYRLPEIGAVYTPDVLVFRDGAGNDLAKKDRFWVDVITAAMLRFPETEALVEDDREKMQDEQQDGNESVDEESEAREPVQTHAVYAEQKDRDMVVAKMRAVMRILAAKGVRRVVLGAWGCGAYGNPVKEISQAWRKVLLEGESKNRRDRKGTSVQLTPWGSVQEVVFAIKEPRMASSFHQCFGDQMVLFEPDQEEDESSSEDASATAELEEKIHDLEQQIQQARTPQLQTGLQAVLENLKRQRAASSS